jgi:hypothetical protein
VEKEGSKGEMITVPDTFNDISLTGKNSGTGENQSIKTSDGLTFAGTAADYETVISSYTGKAYTALNSSQVPDAMKDVVKDYFTELSE